MSDLLPPRVLPAEEYNQIQMKKKCVVTFEGFIDTAHMTNMYAFVVTGSTIHHEDQMFWSSKSNDRWYNMGLLSIHNALTL